MTPNGTNVNGFFHRKIERQEKLCLIHKNSRPVLGFITRKQIPPLLFYEANKHINSTANNFIYVIAYQIQNTYSQSH